MVTCVEVSPAVVALVCVSIQGKMNAKYLLEGVWKDLHERRECGCDVDNLNVRLWSSRKSAATGHSLLGQDLFHCGGWSSLTMAATRLRWDTKECTRGEETRPLELSCFLLVTESCRPPPPPLLCLSHILSLVLCLVFVSRAVPGQAGSPGVLQAVWRDRSGLGHSRDLGGGNLQNSSSNNNLGSSKYQTDTRVCWREYEPHQGENPIPSPTKQPLLQPLVAPHAVLTTGLISILGTKPMSCQSFEIVSRGIHCSSLFKAEEAILHFEIQM